MKKREYQYDLLRVLSMIAVIITHVSGLWVDHFSSFISGGGSLSELLHPVAACIYDSISRFAVPCFVMLSGAFLLADEKNSDYPYFYKKSFYKIGIPGIIFTILYTIYRIPLCFIGANHGPEELIRVVSDIICGKPMAHMWYFNMLIGLYLLVPVILHFKNSISENTFCKIAVVFLVFACLSCWTTENVRLYWSIGLSFEYVGYLLIGYVLRKKQWNTRHRFTLIALGVLIAIGTAFIQYYFQIVQGIEENNLAYPILSPYSPPIVVASVLIFSGFSKLRIPKLDLVVKLSENSFVIYLVHMGVLDVITKLLTVFLGRHYYLTLNCVIWIPVLTAITLLVSYFLALLYNKIYPKLHFERFMQSRKNA